MVRSMLVFMMRNKILGGYIYKMVVKKMGGIGVVFFGRMGLVFLLFGRVVILKMMLGFYERLEEVFEWM